MLNGGPDCSCSSPSNTGTILVEVSAGELLDKITVLRIKAERIGDDAKLANVRNELDVLEEVRRRRLGGFAQVDELVGQLKAVNEKLWEVIEEIYRLESTCDFGDRFVELARSVYRLNDARALLKREVNLLVGSRLVEEKAHDIARHSLNRPETDQPG